MTTPLSLNRRMARGVALYGRDLDDKRFLLDVLGLVDGPTGREVLPDDLRDNDLPDLSAPITPTTAANRFIPEPAMRDRSAIPVGLRDATPPAAPTSVTTKSRRTHQQESPVSSPPAPPVIDLPTEDSTGPYIAALRALELFADPAYQRPLDMPRVKRMVATWSPKMLGVLDVSDRGADEPVGQRYAIVNGQHRCAAALLATTAPADLWVACNVHEGLDAAGEADLMYELDRGTKALGSWDKWKLRRAAGDPVVLGIEACAEKHGLRIRPDLAEGGVGASGAAEKLYRSGGPELLGSVFAVLVDAYGRSQAAFKAPMLTGLGAFLTRHATDLTVDRLVDALRRTTPQQIKAQADSLREVDGGSLSALMTRAIVGQYNRTPGSKLTAGAR